jgi:hypothetical protein
VKFSNLFTFVEKEANKANDPLFGRTRIDAKLRSSGQMKDKR